MDADTEVERAFRHDKESDDEEEEKKHMRPPSSYGSMKSESDMEQEDEIPVPLPESTPQEGPGLRLIRSESPETLYTMTTQQTKPPGAVVIETRSSDLEMYPEEEEEEEEDLDEILIATSPEPPEPVELEDTMQTDENGQPGRLHPEQDLPHVFKSIQSVLTELNKDELFKFKMWFYQWESSITLQQVMEGDLLDFVDRILEILEQDRALMHTISTLENVNKKEEAAKLRNNCLRLLMRFHLKQYLIRKHEIIREGVVRAGKQNVFNTIFVEPKLSTCAYGGIDPSHEFRRCPTPLQVPSEDTLVSVNNLFRLQKDDGSLVRTVVTTGIPGIGLSVIVGKFCLDWAELRANRDLQFVIKLTMQAFCLLQHKPPMSIMEMIEILQPECKDMKFLEEEGCKFLIIIDSFDVYQTALDWENTPVINDNYTQADTSALIVNIIRGTVLHGAQVWILGRAAAVSQIPSQFIDRVTEIQGFSDEMIDDYLTRRYIKKTLAEKIVRQYKHLPSLQILARHPFVSWMVATTFERCFRYVDYGQHPPRLTPFYINIMIVQTNRKLQFYLGRRENDLSWSNDEVNFLTKMGKMALKMLERNVGVFYEEDVKECGLKLTEVTVFSGLCTELPASASEKRRRFCFIHFSFQEFMAALYVFTMFRTEAKNVLDSGMLQMPKIFTSKYQTKSAAGLIQCALARTLSAELGYYEMFLRFLCGMLSPDCHDNQLSGSLYRHNAPKVGGLDEVQRLLEQTIQTAPADRVLNLKECIREMTQEDE